MMGDKDTREIVFDLAGGALSQSAAEMIINEANAPGSEQFVTITIKNIHRNPGMGVPRLIVDYGDLIHRVVTEMDRREKEKK
jgi:hypothetical protein